MRNNHAMQSMPSAIGVALSLVAVVSGGCGISTRQSLRIPAQPVAEGSRVTIAVTPFRIRNAAKLKPDDVKLKEFEQYYFAARLIETLRQSPAVRDAFLAPEKTPSTDYHVVGEIVESDGEDTRVVVTVARLGQAKALRPQPFHLDLSSSDFKRTDPTQSLWIAVANGVLEQVESASPDDLRAVEAARLREYLGSDVSGGRATSLIQEAARIEQTELLRPITDLGIRQAQAATAAYATWQKETTKLAEESREKKTMATVGVMVSLLGAAASGMNEGQFGGPTPASIQARQNAEQLMVASIMQAERAGDIDAAIKTMRTSFAGNASELKVSFDQATYTLVGSPAEQMRQFRQVVRECVLTASRPSSASGA